MASLTIRNLDEPLKKRLRIQAAHNGRSMEEEVRQILRQVLDVTPLRLDAPQPALPVPMRIPPPSVLSPQPIVRDVPTFTPKPLTLVAGSDTDRAASLPDLPPIPSDVKLPLAPDLTSMMASEPAPVAPAAPVSVEAFTDGLRQRLAMLVGVEASNVRRDV